LSLDAPQVAYRADQTCGVVAEETKAAITTRAKQTTNTTGLVTVIDC